MNKTSKPLKQQLLSFVSQVSSSSSQESSSSTKSPKISRKRKLSADDEPEYNSKESSMDENYSEVSEKEEEEDEDFEIKKKRKTKQNSSVSRKSKYPKKKEGTSVVDQRKESEQDHFQSGFSIESPQSSKKNSTSKNKKNSGYTQLEQQYINIKKKYPDTILFVECGYKYKLFGEDAELASKLLNIYCFQSHNFMVASIPTQRLQFHLSRIVNAGYKVGVVSQTETAALKAISTTKAQPFNRDLTALYTPGTYISPELNWQDSPSPFKTTYLMCLNEQSKGQGQNQKFQFGFIALELSTGDIIYDEFMDDLSCGELETRIVQLLPREMIFSSSVSKHTRQFIKSILVHQESDLRVEEVDVNEFQYEITLGVIEKKANQLMNAIQSLPKFVIGCIGVLLNHLEAFKLDKVFQLKENILKFSSISRMMLNGTALSNLEILMNSTNNTEKGSLFWVLNHTYTPFGGRLLKKWIAQPLFNVDEIKQRLDAVEELAFYQPNFLSSFIELFKRLPDLEKGLCRIHYKKCTPAEFVIILSGFNQIVDNLPNEGEINALRSNLLKSIFKKIPSNLTQITNQFLSKICSSAAQEGNKLELFINSEEVQEITKCKEKIMSVRKELENHLQDLKKKLKKKDLEYVTKLQTEYLIEVDISNLKGIPDDWVKMSATKTVVRYHTPFIIEQLKIIAQNKERLILECDAAWENLLGKFGQNYHFFHQIVQQLANLDCLLSLSTTAKSLGYTKPIVSDEEQQLIIVEGRNPIIELLNPDTFVPNDSLLNSNSRCMIVTGPNMGGKSSYIRQIALIVIMAQIGSFVPATECKLRPFDSIFTRMGAADDILAGQSTFFVELQQTSHMLRNVTPRSLVILDELGRGTSTIDGCAIAYSTLKHLLVNVKCLVLFVTHYWRLTKVEEEFPDIAKNYHMAYIENPDREPGEPLITFLYKLVSGPSERSYGLNVAKLAGISEEIISKASIISKDYHLLKQEETNDNETITREQMKILQDFKYAWNQIISIQK